MKRIKLYLDYHCYPMWIYDENDMLVANDLVEELKCDLEVADCLDEIQNIYDSLFEDNKICFKYKGFENQSERELLMNKISFVSQIIDSKLGELYRIVNQIKI